MIQGIISNHLATCELLSARALPIAERLIFPNICCPCARAADLYTAGCVRQIHNREK